MKTFAFKNRLFVTYTAVITLVVAIFSVILLTTSAGMNREAELYHQEETYKANLSEIENILRQMERLAAQVVGSNEILSAFIPLAADEDAANYFDQNLIDAIRVSSLLQSINGTENFAARISLFNRNGDYVSTGTLYETPDRIAAALETPAYYDEMMARVSQSATGSAVLDFHEDTWSNHETIRLISLYRALSSYTQTAYGLVDIQVGANVFDQLPFWQQDGVQEYLLVNRAGEVIYPFDVSEDLVGVLPTVVEAVNAQQTGVSVVEEKLNREDVVLMASRVAPADWMLVRIIKAQALMAPYLSGYAQMILVSIVLLVCLVLLVNYLAIRITRPLGALTASIAGVNLQNMQQAIEETGGSYATQELNALSAAFGDMINRLDKSISMEMQAQMRALQSQMNPHFLYNMLSVIIESSEEEGDERTVSMCLKLSQMLRYIADYDGDTASLSEELAHTRNYLDLMKDRYEDQFTFEIAADDVVGQVVVPKMIVQPLAENCFSHGFRDCRPPWHIRIEAKVEGDRWRLTVTDNGTGITAEAVAGIYERVETVRADVATNYKTLRLGGMGLVNTMLRLSLSQGDAIEFTIGALPEGGTVVRIGGMMP